MKSLLSVCLSVRLPSVCPSAKFGSDGPKSDPKLVFFVAFSSLINQFSWKLHRMIAWNIVSIKLLKKISGAPDQVRNQGRVFAIFSRFHHQFSLILHYIAAWDNVLQLVELKPQKKKKKFGGQNWGRNDLFYSNVVERPLNLAVILTLPLIFP